MHKIVFGILLDVLFLSLKTNAQQFKIIAAEDGAALPFATLINYTHPNLVSANVNGIAEFPAQVGDSLAASYVGYKTTVFIYNTKTNQTIRLFKTIDVLKPVTVLNCKNTKTFKYGNKSAVNYTTMENGERSYFSGLEWWGLRGTTWKNYEFAVRLNPEKENTILKSFSFWLQKSNFGPKSAINAPLIFSFYDVTDSITPGKLLTETPLFYYPQKTGKQILNLDSFHLKIPPKGIFISFKIVMNEAYAWTQTVKMKGSTRDTIISCYGGRIVGFYTKDFDCVGFNPLTNKWQNWINWNKKSNGDNDLHASIKCEAVLKYCVD